MAEAESPTDSEEDPLQIFQQERSRLERLAASDLPIAEDAQRGLDRLAKFEED